MRSVYVKISLWSVAILICSSVLFVVSARNNVYRTFAKDGELGPRLSSQLNVAQRIYETEGKEGLAQHLHSLLLNYPGFQHYLVSEGRDLITGEDCSEVWARSRSRRETFAVFAPISVSASSTDGRYVFIAMFPRGNGISGPTSFRTWCFARAPLSISPFKLGRGTGPNLGRRRWGGGSSGQGDPPSG